MANYAKSIVVLTALIAVLGGGYLALNQPSRAQQTIETATWEQLIKPGAYDIFDNWDYIDSLTDQQVNQIWEEAEAATNPVMEGKRIQIPGFMVSLDLSTDRQVNEFIFVPYQGACIHTPPPPPNQTIFVKAPEGTKVWNNWEPVEVTGKLVIEANDAGIAESGFTLIMDNIQPFEYDRYDPDYAVETAVGAHGE